MERKKQHTLIPESNTTRLAFYAVDGTLDSGIKDI